MKQYASLLQKHHSAVSTSRLTPQGSPPFLGFPLYISMALHGELQLNLLPVPGIAPGSEQAVLTQPELEPSHC